MEFKSTPSCPICSSTEEKVLIEAVNEYQIFRCPACDVEFAYPFKAPEHEFYIGGAEVTEPSELLLLIQKSRYETEYGVHSYLMSLVYTFYNVQLELYWPQRKFIADYLPSHSKVLDIGCGTCIFLAYAKRSGCEVWGIDINPNFINACRFQRFNKTFVATLREFFEKFPHNTFDVITMFEVLEHLDNPVETLSIIHRLLRKDGILAISVPNNERGRLKFGLKRTEEDYPPHHLTRWTPKAISGFVERMGFEVLGHHIAPIDLGYSISRRIFDPVSPRRVFKMVEKWQNTKKVHHDLNRIHGYAYTRHYLLSNLLKPFGIILNILGFKGKSQLIVAKRI